MIRAAEELLERVLADRPAIHWANTERDPTRWSDLGVRAATPTCYGISEPLARDLLARLGPGMHTLETGAGVSTLVFALAEARHTAVSPDSEEHAALQGYARRIGIDMTRVRFVAEPSDRYLPACKIDGLDVVLLDGKHAFPWPIVDWFHTADRLKIGGLMILDDTQLRPVRVLADFLRSDADRWRLEGEPGGRTSIFRKLTHPVHDVNWMMQPWTVGWHSTSSAPSWRRWVWNLLGKGRP